MLEIQNLLKTNGVRVVLNKINVTIDDGEFFCFLGPSGSGKTALMRIIAGLEKPDSGKILLKGENILKYPAYKRNINTIFSSFALFPDYSLYKNIEYGLNFKSIGKREKERIINEAIDFFELSNYIKEDVSTLDNLVKYKIALCRALICNPDVLLLDDSLRLLSRKDRIKMRYELKKLQKFLKKTVIYITDNIDNAFTLSDRIAVMQHGTIHQCAPAYTIYETPSTYFVASYISDTNIFYARIKNFVEGHYVVELDEGKIIECVTTNKFEVGQELFFALRPERIKLSYTNDNEKFKNYLFGKIVQKDYRGEYTEYFIELEYGKLIVVAEPNYNFLFNDIDNDNVINFYEVGENVYIIWNIMSGNLLYA